MNKQGWIIAGVVVVILGLVQWFVKEKYIGSLIFYAGIITLSVVLFMNRTNKVEE